MPKDWRIFVMGGLLRDLLLEHIRCTKIVPADVDVVIAGAGSADAVGAILGRFYPSRNEFGGAKCRMRPGGVVFDVWRIEDHANMAEAPQPHTIEQLLRHNLLDIDAALWEPQTGYLHECGCQAAIHSGCIDILGDAGISQTHLAAQAAHILLTALKTGFRLSERAVAFVRSVADRDKRVEVLRIATRKMPESDGELRNLLGELSSGRTEIWVNKTRQ